MFHGKQTDTSVIESYSRYMLYSITWQGSNSPAGQPFDTGSGVGASPPTQEVDPAGQVVPSAHEVHDVEASFDAQHKYEKL
jgi:hypothetical protein